MYMFENIKLTDRSKQDLEMENDTLRKLLHEYVAQVETMKRLYNEHLIGWSKQAEQLQNEIKQLRSTSEDQAKLQDQD